MSTLAAVRRPVVSLLLATLLVLAAGCKRAAVQRLDPVGAIRSRVEPSFRPPPDGLLTGAQVDLYLKVRHAAGSGEDAEAALRLGVDPAELAWVRARIVEALAALDARVVVEAAMDSYSRGIAALREARRGARDPAATARLDAETAGLERERATLRRGEAAPPQLARNAALVSPRRAALESVLP